MERRQLRWSFICETLWGFVAGTALFFYEMTGQGLRLLPPPVSAVALTAALTATRRVALTSAALFVVFSFGVSSAERSGAPKAERAES